jgi:hypothetical protein
MFATFLSQVIADGESSLTTADDNRIDFVRHGRLLDSEAQHKVQQNYSRKSAAGTQAQFSNRPV